MILSLIVGIILGVLAVFFVLQNTAIVTVTFFAWQLQGSLALVLFLAITSGVIMALLFVLPSLIKESLLVRAANKQNKKLEDEVAALRAATSPPLEVVPIPPTSTI